MTWVKICGITNLEDALVAVDAGADALGFVFYEKSPRKVNVQTVRDIVPELPETIQKVGVFVDQTVQTISEIVNQTGLTTVQLHSWNALERVSTYLDGFQNGARTIKTVVVANLGEFANGVAISLSDDAKEKLFG